MTVSNHESRSRFELPLPSGGTGFLQYRIEGDTLALLYVEVPPEDQGHGFAADLCREALLFARERGFKVVPVCSYTAAYLRRHPEHADLMRN